MSDMLRQKSHLPKHAVARAEDKERLISAHTLSSVKLGGVQKTSYCSCAGMKRVLLLAALCLLVLLVPSLVYYFINDADIIDDHYDLSGLEDLTPADKFSVRVTCPRDVKQLQNFVAHYSICPHVLEIGVVSTPYCQSLEDIQFQYVKTHAPVRLVHEEKEETLWAESEGILLLDSDVFIGCDTIKYAHSVWRSASKSMAGFFPRLHTIQPERQAPSADLVQWKYKYYNWLYVWWNSQYSLVHSAGAAIHRSLWKEYIADPNVREVVNRYPHCKAVLPSFWVSLHQRAPPVWIDVDVSIQNISTGFPSSQYPSGGNSDLPKTMSSSQSITIKRSLGETASGGVVASLLNILGTSVKTDAVGLLSWMFSDKNRPDYSECLNLYAKMHASVEEKEKSAEARAVIPTVLYSTHKATPAKEVLCW